MKMKFQSLLFIAFLSTQILSCQQSIEGAQTLNTKPKNSKASLDRLESLEELRLNQVKLVNFQNRNWKDSCIFDFQRSKLIGIYRGACVKIDTLKQSYAHPVGSKIKFDYSGGILTSCNIERTITTSPAENYLLSSNCNIEKDNYSNWILKYDRKNEYQQMADKFNTQKKSNIPNINYDYIVDRKEYFLSENQDGFNFSVDFQNKNQTKNTHDSYNLILNKNSIIEHFHLGAFYYFEEQNIVNTIRIEDQSHEKFHNPLEKIPNLHLMLDMTLSNFPTTEMNRNKHLMLIKALGSKFHKTNIWLLEQKSNNSNSKTRIRISVEESYKSYPTKIRITEDAFDTVSVNKYTYTFNYDDSQPLI